LSDNPNYKAVMVILDDIEKHELIQFNKEFYDEEFFDNFVTLQKAFNSSFAKMVGQLDPLSKNYENLSLFILYSELSYIVSHFDIMNTFFKIILDSSKIKGGFEHNPTLNILIKKICNKMQYPEKLKNSIYGLFLGSFQNAVNTQQYLFQNNTNLVIYPKNKELTQYISIETLYDYSLQIMAIFDAMVDWSNGKKQVKKETNSFDDLIFDFKKQISALDKKLDTLS